MGRPNLLFLMTDQQQAATVAPGSPCQMPHIDALAAAGTRFGRCYGPNPICSPTRASLMTGLLPHSHGMVDCTHTVEPYRAELKPDLSFWSQALRDAGYRTGYYGKWHVERSNRLDRFGFDNYEVTRPPGRSEAVPGKADGSGYRAHRLALGLDEQDRRMARRHLVRQKGYRDLLLYGIADEPVEATGEHYIYSQGIDFLRRAAGEPECPWLLFLSVHGPHEPYVVPREYYDLYDPADIEQPASFGDDLAGRPAIYRRMQSVWSQLEWEQFAEATASYFAYCSLIDAQVGRILAVLEELGQSDDTIVVFCSDHGDLMGAHRMMLKGIPSFEETYRVPLIMKGPGIGSGRQVDRVVSLLDVAPTLVALTTGAVFECQGRSLLPLLQPGDQDWEDEAFAEMQGQRFAWTQRLLWRGRHKYVFNTFDYDELYDLEQDSHEMRNLAEDPAYAPLAEEMAARVWQIARETGDFNLYDAQDGTYRYAPVGPELGRAGT